MKKHLLPSVWRFWREYGALIAERQTTLWLVLVYLGLIGPTWLFSRVVGKRFFAEPHPGAVYWQQRQPGPRTIAEMRRMG
jgi:hypothetical protein